jgi:hypothetical protein
MFSVSDDFRASLRLKIRMAGGAFGGWPRKAQKGLLGSSYVFIAPMGAREGWP